MANLFYDAEQLSKRSHTNKGADGTSLGLKMFGCCRKERHYILLKGGRRESECRIQVGQHATMERVKKNLDLDWMAESDEKSVSTWDADQICKEGRPYTWNVGSKIVYGKARSAKARTHISTVASYRDTQDGGSVIGIGHQKKGPAQKGVNAGGTGTMGRCLYRGRYINITGQDNIPE